MKKIEEKDVIVKISSCNKCKGLVTVAVKHMMTTKTKNSFMRDVMDYNLNVTEQPLLDWKKDIKDFCDCKIS